MADVADSIGDTIVRVYQNFLLRDLLGFALPGAISLSSIWYLIDRPPGKSFLLWLEQPFTAISNAWQVIAILAASYSIVWILQCVHYGIIDWVFQLSRRDKWYRKLLWPVFGSAFYIRSLAQLTAHQTGDHTLPIPTIEESPSLISRGGLAPDYALATVKKDDYPPRMRESFLYTERLAILMVLTGNMALAVVLLTTALAVGGLGWSTFVRAPLFLFLYMEHWRLWYFSNLRHRIYVGAPLGLTSKPDAS